MPNPTDAQLAVIEATAHWVIEWQVEDSAAVQRARDTLVLLAALREARAENRSQADELSDVRGQATEFLADRGELRARIEAVARPASEVVVAANEVSRKYGIDENVGHIIVAKVLGFVRAALFPTETEATGE